MWLGGIRTPSDAIRRAQGDRLSEQSWYQRFDEIDKAERRVLGRQLLSMLVQYLTQPPDRPAILEDARSLGPSYGEHSLFNKLTLNEAVRAFLYVDICWLRRKVEDDPSHPRRILTRRRLGYQFCIAGAPASG